MDFCILRFKVVTACYVVLPSNLSNSSKSAKSTFRLKNMQVQQNHCCL